MTMTDDEKAAWREHFAANRIPIHPDMARSIGIEVAPVDPELTERLRKAFGSKPTILDLADSEPQA